MQMHMPASITCLRVCIATTADAAAGAAHDDHNLRFFRIYPGQLQTQNARRPMHMGICGYETSEYLENFRGSNMHNYLETLSG